MKITHDVMQQLAERITRHDTPETRERYRTGKFTRADAVKNLDKRYRWDLFHACHGWELIPHDCNDAHIDTVLRRIVSPL